MTSRDDVIEPTADEIARVKSVISMAVSRKKGFDLDDLARAAILAMDRRASPPAPAVAVPEGWRDISTAPTGVLLNLYEPHSMGGFQFIGIQAEDGRWRNNLDMKEQHPTLWVACRADPHIAAPTPPAAEAPGLHLETTPAMRARLVELSSVTGADDYDRVVLMLVRDFARCLAYIAPLQDYVARSAASEAPGQEPVAALRHHCAASGRHEYDGCDCSDAEAS